MNSNSKRLMHYVVKQKRMILFGVLATLSMSLVELATGGFLKFLTKTLANLAKNSSLEGIDLIKLPIKYRIKVPWLSDLIFRCEWLQLCAL